MTVRLFVGIEIPGELRERLAFIQAGVERAKWVPRENFHITLRFIGEVDEGQGRDIADELDRIRAPGFELVLSGAGHFESNRRVRQLWIGVARNEALSELRSRVDTVVTRAVGPDNQRFRPHVTVARLNGAKPATVKNWLSANTLFKSIPFAVERFVLFSSFLSKSAAIYRVEAEYPLAPS
jgi:RNA 2',3'-cyclic 3'-phosphodiesterase